MATQALLFTKYYLILLCTIVVCYTTGKFFLRIIQLDKKVYQPLFNFLVCTLLGVILIVSIWALIQTQGKTVFLISILFLVFFSIESGKISPYEQYLPEQKKNKPLIGLALILFFSLLVYSFSFYNFFQDSYLERIVVVAKRVS